MMRIGMKAQLATVACLLLGTSPTSAIERPHTTMNFAHTWVETPFGQPVIDRGPADSWDHAAVDNPYVFCDSGILYCFFEAQDVTHRGKWHERIGIANSTDGVHWTKHSGNPILDIGDMGTWDSVVAKLPAAVIKHNRKYYLFFSGRDHPDIMESSKSIGLATATDILGPWKKSPHNPVLRGRATHWDRKLSTIPTPLFRLHDRYYLLFRGMQGLYHDQGIGVATSDDLVTWTREKNTTSQALTPIPEEIASFAVARTGSGFVAISQPMDISKRRYWLSNDLVHWQKSEPVRMRVSAQAETISNPFLVRGQWNVLYEQRDRIYRAVLVE